MTKKIIIGLCFSLMLTWAFWQMTSLLRLNRQIDDILFAGSPILAIVISAMLVRSKFMAGNRMDDD